MNIVHPQPSIDYRSLVDFENGTVDRRIFSDEEIYRVELERIFARSWNFMCHESQIPNVGDFFSNFIGEEPVIVTRDKNGGINVMLNTCRHRGTMVCRSESGNAKSFMCSYHGWTYDLEGKLIGVPGHKAYYHECLDRAKWGLISAPKVTSYKGFVFANMDPDAPELADFLGPVGRLALDTMAARGDLVVFEGILKNQLPANWKTVVDNSHDWYHVDVAHLSAITTMFDAIMNSKDPDAPVRGTTPRDMQRVLLGEYGHAISGPRLPDEAWKALQEHHETLPRDMPFFDNGWRGNPEVVAEIGDLGGTTMGFPNIFPNFFVTTGGTQISLRLPKGPECTEIWWFSLREKGLSPELERARAAHASSLFGPAGILEQDDSDNWDQSTRATKGPIARRYPFDMSMNLGRSDVKVAPSGVHYSDTHVNEHAQLWTWKCWADWMSAETWEELRELRTPIPPTI